MDIDPIPCLDTFAEAAERSSFTGAAHALGLTQAAVSQRIHTLERDLGVALFQRHGGRVLLTEAGQRLYKYARRILELHQEARQDVSGRSEPRTGELVLAASSVPGEHLLPQLLSRYQRRFPHVTVKASVTDSQVVLHKIEHGEAHLGLVGKKGASPHLEYRCFAWDRLALVVPARHAWAKRKQVSLPQLAVQPLVLREPGSGSRWCLEQALAKVGKSLTDLRVALEVGSNEAIKAALQQGLGLAVLSTHVVKKQVQTGQLHLVNVRGLPLRRPIFAVWDRRRVLPIPAHLFLDLLKPRSLA
jgi:DNA-binding transcriptional LysR family regulator